MRLALTITMQEDALVYVSQPPLRLLKPPHADTKSGIYSTGIWYVAARCASCSSIFLLIPLDWKNT